MTKAAKQAKRAPDRSPADDFASVARRLECDEDLEAFDAKLKRIAKAKTGKPD